MRRHTFFQKGTSMLHIMAILLIAGILSVGGYAVFVFGLTKNLANNLAKESDMRAVDLQTSVTLARAKPREVLTPMGYPESSDRIWTHVKVDDNLFAITMDGISQRVCHRLTELPSEHVEAFYVNCMDALVGDIKDCIPAKGRSDLCLSDTLNYATFVYKASAMKVGIVEFPGDNIYEPTEEETVSEKTEETEDTECPPEAPYRITEGLKTLCCKSKKMTICGTTCCAEGAPCCGGSECCENGSCCNNLCYEKCNTNIVGALPRSEETGCECICDTSKGFKKYKENGLCVCASATAQYDEEKGICDEDKGGYFPIETECESGHAPEAPKTVRCCYEGESLVHSYDNYKQNPKERKELFCCPATEEEAEKGYVYFDYSEGTCVRKDICPHRYDGIAFILDNSGSMINYPQQGQKRLVTLKNALKEIADMDILSKEVNVGIYTFADKATGTLLDYKPYNKNSFRSAVNGLSAISCPCTCVGCGLRYGYSQTYKKGYTPLVVLLTDGSSTCYPTNANGSQSCSYYTNCVMISKTEAECDINYSCTAKTTEVGLALKQSCSNLFKMVVFGFDYKSADLDTLAKYGGQPAAEYATSASLANQLKAIAKEFDCIPRESEATCQNGCPKNATFSTSVKDKSGATGVCVCNTPNYYLKENFTKSYSISCQPCPAGTYRKKGTNYCSTCPAGKTSNGKGGDCVAQ